MADSLTDSIAHFEATRLDLDDPREQLCEVVSDGEADEVAALIYECVEVLRALEDACNEFVSACQKRRLNIRRDAALARRALAALRKGLKSIGDSEIAGKELLDRMDTWNEAFDDWDSGLGELIELAHGDEATSDAS